MSTPDLPALVEPSTLDRFRDDNLVLIDLSARKTRARYAIPGSVWLDYRHIVEDHPPVAGLLPPIDSLSRLLGELGIDRDTSVIAYDDEGGGKAARLLWTLDCLGHHRHALLDGGLVAWLAARLPLGDDAAQHAPRQFAPRPDDDRLADAAFILSGLEDGELQLIDARSVEEFDGTRRLSARGGHIPGAIHCDWLELMDRQRDMRLLTPDALRALLAAKGIVADRETVVYCQTHHRSSLMYYALRSVGFARVRGYPGSWSDWGNRPDTPVAT